MSKKRQPRKDDPTDSCQLELSEAQAEQTPKSVPYEAPRSRSELLLAELWQQALCIGRIGIHDNFFELGGDSVTAALVLNELQDRLGKAVPIVAIFDAPTIAGLATYLNHHHADAVSRICCDEKTQREERTAERIDATNIEQRSPIIGSSVSFAAGPKDGAAPTCTPIRPILRSDRTKLPLSFGQRRLWFLNRLHPDNPAYSAAWAIRIEGPLELAALRNALEAIVARHASLRTTFGTVDGSPIQVVKRQANVTLSLRDLNVLPEREREAAALRLAEEEARRPFDLERGPLLRTTLLRLTEADHLLVFTIHHIVVDGWSMGVLIQELLALYPSFAAGEPPSLSELPIQYADFAIWERQWLQGPRLEKLLSYWKRQLSGGPASLPLPTDHPRPMLESLRGATRSFALPKELSSALIALSRREGSTLFMTLLAAFQTLLHRYTSQTDILVGTPVANRARREIEPLIGFFVNTLVLRADLSGDPTFRELLGRVREVALEAYAHQDLPFEKLVEELRPERDLGRNPLFQVMFILQNAPMPKLELAKLRASLVEVETGTAKFDLTLSMQQTEQGLRGKIEYSRDLFDPETMMRMVGHWRALLEGIVADPGQRLSQLPLLTTEERRQLVVEWNDTRAESPREQCIHQLLEEQTERTPEAVAVVCEDRQLTYGELNRRGNQLAHSLRKLGVGPEVRVGLSVERSLEMIVGLVGILKAGGAYVPLDPAYPRERLAFMLEDAQVSLLVTSKTASEWLPKDKTRAVCIDIDREFVSPESTENPVPTAGPDSLAYVIYTSGSTGRPKGVLVDHRNLVHSTRARINCYQDRSIRFLLLSSFAFDSSLAGIFGTLSQGGTLVLPRPGLERDPSRLAELIAQKQISHLLSLPSLYGLLLEQANPEQLRSLRRVIVAGEACSREVITRHNKQLPLATVCNEYGPTESTIWSSVHMCRGPVSQEQVPIGRPIANTQIYIVDEHLEPVPIGVLGELHIGGAGLARGYLNKPELTAEKFIPNPFAENPGARLYKTGDRARYLADGSIEFLGRLDEQVKIRGFRVELGEVEAVLAEHPGVKAAAIVVREDSLGEKRMMAFVTLRPGFAGTVEDLFSFLKRKLPEYMLPWKVEITEHLPLTPSGKVDRHRLRALSDRLASPKNECSAPRTALEEELVRIWSEVLKLERVGVHDNFFDLGGHSLLAVKLMAEVEKHTGKKLSLAGMVQAPTIQDQAALLAVPSSSAEIPGVIPIQPRGSGPAFFCLGAGPLFRPLALRLGTEHPFLGLGLVESEVLDLSVPFKLEDVAARLLSKLRALQPQGPYCLGGWCDDGVLAYEVAQQLQAAGQRTLLVLFDAWNPALWRTHFRREAFRARFQHWIRSLGCHLSNLRGLPRRKQWEYLGETWNMQRRILGNKLWRTRYKVLLRVKGKVPSGPRDFNKIEFVAVRGYEPKPFAGNVVLFWSGTEDQEGNQASALGWHDLVPTGLEIHRVPGSHRGMFAEPNVEALAKVLRTRLWKAAAVEDYVASAS